MKGSANRSIDEPRSTVPNPPHFVDELLSQLYPIRRFVEVRFVAYGERLLDEYHMEQQ